MNENLDIYKSLNKLSYGSCLYDNVILKEFVSMFTYVFILPCLIISRISFPLKFQGKFGLCLFNVYNVSLVAVG